MRHVAMHERMVRIVIIMIVDVIIDVVVLRDIRRALRDVAYLSGTVRVHALDRAHHHVLEMPSTSMTDSFFGNPIFAEFRRRR